MESAHTTFQCAIFSADCPSHTEGLCRAPIRIALPISITFGSPGVHVRRELDACGLAEIHTDSFGLLSRSSYLVIVIHTADISDHCLVIWPLAGSVDGHPVRDVSAVSNSWGSLASGQPDRNATL